MNEKNELNEDSKIRIDSVYYHLEKKDKMTKKKKPMRYRRAARILDNEIKAYAEKYEIANYALAADEFRKTKKGAALFDRYKFVRTREINKR